MTRILVYPEKLESLSQSFQHASNQVREIEVTLQRALNQMNWETKNRANIESYYQQVKGHSQYLTSNTEELARFLKTKANAFREADSQGVKGLSGETSGTANIYKGTVPLTTAAAAGVLGLKWENAFHPKKWISHLDSLKGIADAAIRDAKGFKVELVKRASGNFYRVTNGMVENINGRRYYLSNAHNYPQVAKWVDWKVASKEAVTDALTFRGLKSMKTLGNTLGGIGVVAETGYDLYSDIKRDASASETLANATVNVGVGLGSIGAGAAVGAAVGSVVPVGGTIVGAVVGAGVGVGITIATDVFTIDGKSASDHAKETVKEVYDGIGEMATDVWKGLGFD